MNDIEQIFDNIDQYTENIDDLVRALKKLVLMIMTSSKPQHAKLECQLENLFKIVWQKNSPTLKKKTGIQRCLLIQKKHIENI